MVNQGNVRFGHETLAWLEGVGVEIV